MQVYTRCSNYATDTCPCVLAESGNCIVCSMCGGEAYCACADTVSFCVLRELMNRGGKATPRHESSLCEVTYVKEYDDIRLVRIRVPRADEYKKLGAYVMIRTREDPFFDVPISVLYEDHQNDTIGLIIQIAGIKTGCFRSLKRGDGVYVRGPYFNGVQGRKSVMFLKNSRAVMLCRGIGFIPSLHVIDALQQNENSVEVYADRGQFSTSLLSLFQNLYEVPVEEVDFCDQRGELSEELCRIVGQAAGRGVGLIHLGLSDNLQKKALDRIEEADPEGRMAVSCINNARICCGEGVCGACAKDLGAGHTVRLCKEQLSMREYKELL